LTGARRFRDGDRQDLRKFLQFLAVIVRGLVDSLLASETVDNEFIFFLQKK